MTRGRAERLGGARLGGARLGGARLGGARLGAARLGRARLDGARLGRARLGRARLEGAWLDEARLGAARPGGIAFGGIAFGGIAFGGIVLGGLLLGGLLLGGLLLGGLTACVEDRGRPPVARLFIEPRYVPVGETTEVLLDGRRSCDEIDHPETCDKTVEGTTGPPLSCPGGLTFHWSLDAPYERVPGEGAVDAPYMKVRVTTERPITVTLRVTDCDQNQVTTQTQIGIEMDYPQPDAGVDAGADAGVP